MNEECTQASSDVKTNSLLKINILFACCYVNCPLHFGQTLQLPSGSQNFASEWKNNVFVVVFSKCCILPAPIDEACMYEGVSFADHSSVSHYSTELMYLSPLFFHRPKCEKCYCQAKNLCGSLKGRLNTLFPPLAVYVLCLVLSLVLSISPDDSVDNY